MKLSRKELYDLVWSTPMSKLAPQYGLSDKGLANKCKKHNIPKPPLGYWTKISCGKKVRKTPLPTNNTPDLDVIPFTEESEQNKNTKHQAFVFPDEIAANLHNFKVPDRITNYHPLIAQTRKHAKKTSTDRYGQLFFGITTTELEIKVTHATFDRACRLLHTLIKLFKSFDWEYVELDRTYRENKYASFSNGKDQLQIRIKEPIKRSDHIKTEKEKSDKHYYGPTYDYHPTLALELSITNIYSAGFKTRWKDTKKERIEEQIINIAEGFYKAFQFKEIQRLKSESDERERERQSNTRKEKQRLEKIEKLREEHLLLLADNYKKADSIRILISALQQTHQNTEVLSTWIDWAEKKANDLDPTLQPEMITQTFKQIKENTSMPKGYY